MEPKVVKIELAGRPLLDRDRPARQAGGRLRASCATATPSCWSPRPQQTTAREEVDFLPLTVDYQEKTFAAGKIPGGFFKREGRPSEKEILTSRLIDRPIRPLFPKGWHCETQIIATVLSADKDNDPDVLALTGASAALHRLRHPVRRTDRRRARRARRRPVHRATRPPSSSRRATSTSSSRAAATRIVMVEGGAKIVPDEVDARGAVLRARGAAADHRPAARAARPRRQAASGSSAAARETGEAREAHRARSRAPLLQATRSPIRGQARARRQARRRPRPRSRRSSAPSSPSRKQEIGAGVRRAQVRRRARR